MDIAIDLGKVSIPVMISVILGAVVVEMLCPLKELLKATNTAIRDIIFDNKDTEYKYKKKNLVISIVSLIIAATMAVLSYTVYKDKAVISVLGFVFLVLAFFSGYSFFLRAISKRFENFSLKHGSPVLGLAATNLRTKKTSIGSSKLAFIATSLCLVLFIIITSFQSDIKRPPADADVVLKSISENADTYDYISTLEGVSKVEFEFKSGDSILVGPEKIEDYIENKYDKKFDDEYVNVEVLGADGNPELNKGYKGLPDVINGDEIYIAKKVAKDLNLKVGDRADIMFNPQGVVPYRDTFKVAGIIDSSKADGSNKTIVLPLDIYKQIYFERPSAMYIKTDNPEKTTELIKSYSSSTIGKIKTMDEFVKESINDSAGIMTILYMIIIMGVVLSLIGIFCNQIVGFESRKRESAVLVSTALSRNKLVKLFSDENILSGIISIGLGTIVGLGETVLLFKAIKNVMAIDMTIDYGKTAVFLALMFITFTITILRTIRNIKKMKLSEQLRYE